MGNGVTLALVYIRNAREQTIFPVKDIDHAIRLADAIADSDLLNDFVDCNMLDVCWYHKGSLGECWESDAGESFEEYWRDHRGTR